MNEKHWMNTSLADFMVDSTENPRAVNLPYINLKTLELAFTSRMKLLQDLTDKEVDFLCDNNLAPEEIAGSLGYDYASRGTIGRMVERFPKSHEEAVDQLSQFEKTRREEFLKQERMKRKDKKKAKAVLKRANLKKKAVCL